MGIRRAVLAALLLWGLTCLLPGFSHGAIGIGTSCGSGSDSVLSFSFSCTTSGSDRLVVAGSRVYPETAVVTAITYGGDAMTLIGSETVPSGDEVYQYHRIAPAAGSQTFSMTFDMLVDMGAVVTPLTGVHQVTPTGTPAGTHAGPGVSSASVNVTSAVGELVLDVIYLGDDTGMTPGAGQTQQGTASRVYVSTEAAAGSPVAMSWSWSNADSYAMHGVSIKPVAAAGVKRKVGILWLD